jgi:hypothetical protein
MGRITIDGKVAQFSLKEDLHPDDWNSKKERTTGKTGEQMALNRKIDQTEQSIKDIYAKMVDYVGYVTAEQIKNELTGAVTKTEYLLKLFEEHNLEFEKRVGKDRSNVTYRQYNNSYNHLSLFILSEYELKDYPLKQLNLDFIEDYEHYLRVDADLSVGSTLNHIIFLKKMVTIAMKQKTLLYDPFPEYEVKKPKPKFLYVSREALERIMSMKINSKSLCFVRDMFVFSCFTGLAYADICQISEQHLHQMPDGSIWIEIPRYKTDVESKIRLLDIPIFIIEKYRPERNGERLAVSKSMAAKLCIIFSKYFDFF